MSNGRKVTDMGFNFQGTYLTFEYDVILMSKIFFGAFNYYQVFNGL